MCIRDSLGILGEQREGSSELLFVLSSPFFYLSHSFTAQFSMGSPCVQWTATKRAWRSWALVCVAVMLKARAPKGSNLAAVCECPASCYTPLAARGAPNK